MARLLTSADQVMVDRFGCEIAELVNDRAQSLQLKVWEFGGVSRFWSTNADKWHDLVPALLVQPLRTLPQTKGVNQRLVEVDDTYRIVYVRGLPTDGTNPFLQLARDTALIVDALASDTGFSRIADDLHSDHAVQVVGSVSQGPEWDPPENVELEAASQTLRAVAIPWRVRWRSILVR